MKKVYTRPKWKRYQRRRQQRELGRSRGARAETKGIPQRSRSFLRAPEDFRLIENTEEMVRFFAEVRREGAQTKELLWLDLSGVDHVGPESVVALISLLRACSCRVSGNLPTQARARLLWNESGFWGHVRPIRNHPQSTPAGVVGHAESRTVDSPHALELCYFATKQLSGKPVYLRGAYAVLVEAMANTRDHAGDKPEVYSWWASVYCDKSRKRALFTFVDPGVGIFRSTKTRSLIRYLRQMIGGEVKRTDVLRDILHGRIPSRTGLRNRGKGLPRMRIELHDRKRIHRLVVLSNNVLAEVGIDSYQELKRDFHGTMIYLEVEVDEHGAPRTS